MFFGLILGGGLSFRGVIFLYCFLFFGMVWRVWGSVGASFYDRDFLLLFCLVEWYIFQRFLEIGRSGDVVF